MILHRIRWVVLTGLVSLLLVSCGGGEDPAGTPETKPKAPTASGGSLKNQVKHAMDKGLNYLHGQFDLDKGGWKDLEGNVEPGITALVLQALARSPRKYTANDGPFMARSLDTLASLAKEDGSIHAGQLASYTTSAAVQALVFAGGTKYRALVDRARDYLINHQLDESEGFEQDHKFYGGAGYGGDRRPDMSNLSVWTDGLLAAGEKRGSAPFQRALRFLERCQNDSEVNTLRHESEGKVVVSGNDGGGVYMPGDSKAGYVDNGDGTVSPRSYGSMTYALLKGYMAADLKPDDPRVKRALAWISNHFTLKENPGFDKSRNPQAGLQGLYYYYYTMAKALDLYGQDVVKDAKGREHRWREELARELLRRQNADGSWINSDSPRWWEGNPNLATPFAVLALETCLRGL